MPKSANQKLKLLYLMRIFMEKTDEAHPITVKEIIDELERYDISAERKSIYSDIESLRLFGMDIVQTRGKNTAYYVGAREFELPELKLLVDSIQSSKFITRKKTLELIKKLEGLASVYDAQLLQRQVFVQNRVKSMNESVYYNVDEVSDAISRDRQIKFKYFEYTVSKEKRFRKNGEYYTASPFALIWDDENYYMLAFDEKLNTFKHYRVDKMAEISALEEKRLGEGAFEEVDMSAYTTKVFGMFTGQERSVVLRFKNYLAGAVIDRFGKNIIMTVTGDEWFNVSVDVAVSPQFMAWLFGFGGDVEVMSPEDVRRELKDKLLEVLGRYE